MRNMCGPHNSIGLTITFEFLLEDESIAYQTRCKTCYKVAILLELQENYGLAPKTISTAGPIPV
jgi:hypothetical protein